MFRKLKTLMSSGSTAGYFLQAFPITCLVGIVYFAVRLHRLKAQKVWISWPQEVLRLIFVCYLTGLVNLIVLPANFWLYLFDGVFLGWWEDMGPVFQLGEINLVPSLVKCWQGTLSIGSWVKTMLIGNIAMFIPFGFFLPLVTKVKRRTDILIAAVLVPLGLEGLQLIFGRSFDVDDLLCNFLGIIIGAGIAFTILKGRSRAARKRRAAPNEK